MKLKTLYEDAVDSAEYALLTEAVRFGSRQKEILAQYERLFRVGCEYEFHLDRDVLGLIPTGPDSFMDEAREMMYNNFVNTLKDEFKPLATMIDELSMILSSNDDIEEMIDDAESGDPDLFQEVVATLTKPTSKMAIQDIVKELSIENGFPAVRNEFFKLKRLMPNIEGSGEQAIMAFRQLDLTNTFELIDEADDATHNAIVNNLIRIVQTDSNLGNPEWFQDWLDDVARQKAQHLADIPTMGYEEEYAEWVKDNIDESVKSLISSVEEDASVPEGVEVISKPISLRNTALLMKTMFSFINKYGSTSRKTGLHVNISLRDFGEIDPLQVMTLMDSDFFQNHSKAAKGTRRDIVKWDQRSEMVERNSAKITNVEIERLAEVYAISGVKALEDRLRELLTGGYDPKYRAINWSHFLKNYNPSEKRIEFRFFGGVDYQKRFDEIMGDLMYICYVLLAASKKAHTQDHYKGMMRILDRAARTHYDVSFADLVQEARK